jgi:hypothetical protein
MIDHDGFGHIEMGDDVIEYEQGDSLGVVRVGGHGFYPFCKIINSHNIVVMIGGKRSFTGSKIDAPFGEMDNCNEGV